MCNGRGYLLFDDFYPADLSAEANRQIYRFVAEEPDRTSHF